LNERAKNSSPELQVIYAEVYVIIIFSFLFECDAAGITDPNRRGDGGREREREIPVVKRSSASS
jgi:hypothetical protein